MGTAKRLINITRTGTVGDKQQGWKYEVSPDFDIDERILIWDINARFIDNHYLIQENWAMNNPGGRTQGTAPEGQRIRDIDQEAEVDELMRSRANDYAKRLKEKLTPEIVMAYETPRPTPPDK
ncbi:MAG: hypothetical protein KKF56_01340 [Nanoarchaeota archaeon]|nr:hypothetical protein [Nanoarchaeota archaeon]